MFGFKQAWACLFGALLLGLMILTRYWYPFDSLHRYDFLFIAAIVIQIFLIAFRLEHWREVGVIAVFHVVATLMELFKTHPAIGSWIYPEPAVFKIGNVPLFTGFMYSAVGSYLARVWRAFDFQFSNYPKPVFTWWLVLLTYLNFFSHHFIWDLRWVLLTASLLLFFPTWVHFRVDQKHRKMPLVLGFFLVAVFIWFAENIATFFKIWFYPDQMEQWQPVSAQKILAWYLLMLLSFVLVSWTQGIKTLTKPNSTG